MGIRAVHVDGKTPDDERRRLLGAIATGEIQLLTNAGLISEGVDVPVIDLDLAIKSATFN